MNDLFCMNFILGLYLRMCLDLLIICYFLWINLIINCDVDIYVIFFMRNLIENNFVIDSRL